MLMAHHEGEYSIISINERRTTLRIFQLRHFGDSIVDNTEC